MNIAIKKTTSTTAAILLAVFAFSTAIFGFSPEDPAVFRPSGSTWFKQSADESGSFSAVKWGMEGDVPVSADFDGDGIKDTAVWRPSTGVWYILRSTDGNVDHFTWGMTTQHPTGGLADVPAPADFDGDGRADIAVFRMDTGIWYVLTSTSGYDHRKAVFFPWGQFGDVPVEADYDGDGRTDFAVFRPLGNKWFISLSSTGEAKIATFGTSGYDQLVPADYSGDGRAEIAIFREGEWHTLDLASGSVESTIFGPATGTPAPADYDGDGEIDLAVFDRGMWYIFRSTTGELSTLQFGSDGDLPTSGHKARRSIVAVP